jgi:2-phospho-L-lactate guanylyltransferase
VVTDRGSDSIIDPGAGQVPGWILVLPLKGGAAAKSRLGGGPALARAIALDCLDAVLACPDVRRVLVVTADQGTAADAVAAAGTRPARIGVVPETRPGSGLVAAVRDGLAAIPDGAPAAVLLGDLPALRPADLSAGLHAAAATLAAWPDAPMAAIPDAEGSGTVLLAGRAASDLDPAFGPGSLAEHRARGAIPVVHDELDARLRHDVDTPADLSVALVLGVGPRTSALLAAARPAS